eukprot:1138846-Pelagomonas_calceolata.AAC.3
MFCIQTGIRLSHIIHNDTSLFLCSHTPREKARPSLPPGGGLLFTPPQASSSPALPTELGGRPRTHLDILFFHTFPFSCAQVLFKGYDGYKG